MAGNDSLVAKMELAYWAGQEGVPVAERCTAGMRAALDVVYAAGEFELSGLIVRPGDTLIIVWKAPLSEERAEILKARVRDRIPGLHDVVVVNADGLAVYRPDPVSGDDEHAG
ncbi:MAG TPA: hypothetical protein VIP28_09010 [Nocardioides sp.]